MLVAGHETTATALTWAMYWIHSLPKVKQTLLAELDNVSDPTDPDQFIQLPYLAAVCNETLRINPVGMLTFPRRVEKPLELCGFQLEPGMLLMGCIYLIHQRKICIPSRDSFVQNGSWKSSSLLTSLSHSGVEFVAVSAMRWLSMR